MQIKFSVIVPVYNVEPYLKRCVDSILGQNFTNFEVILVDDGSTDQSGNMCDAYKKKGTLMNRVCHVIHQKNAGLSEARNTGIRIASGEYLLFVDSDDFWEDNGFLDRIDSYLKEKPDFLLFSFKRCDETGTKLWTCNPVLKESLINHLVYEKAQAYFMKQDAYLISACCKAIRTEFLREKKLYFEKGLLSEDIDWHIKLVLAAKSMVYSNENGYVYRLRENSITTAPKEKNRQDLYQIIAKWADYFGDESGRKKKVKREIARNRKEELRKTILPLLAYEYFILLGYYDGYEVPCEVKLEKYAWLIHYGESKKIRMCRLVYKITGRKKAGRLYGYIVKKRQGGK